MNVENWPTWEDGKPVKVGEMAMSSIGPLRIDGIEILDVSWRLWSNQSMYEGAEKWLYVIDEGDFKMGHPTRYGEECEFWQPGDPVMPDWVFAPLDVNASK